jgi:hypothetical protein
MRTNLYLIKHIWIMYSVILFSLKSIMYLHMFSAEGLCKLFKCFDVKLDLGKKCMNRLRHKSVIIARMVLYFIKHIRIYNLVFQNELCPKIVFLFFTRNILLSNTQSWASEKHNCREMKKDKLIHNFVSFFIR